MDHDGDAATAALQYTRTLAYDFESNLITETDAWGNATSYQYNRNGLLRLLGCLDTPTSGLYEFNGVNVSDMDDNQLAKIRNKEIGFVFQTFNLLPGFTALENVLPPTRTRATPSSTEKRSTR